MTKRKPPATVNVKRSVVMKYGRAFITITIVNYLE